MLAPLLLVVCARYLGRAPLTWAMLALASFLFWPVYAAIILGVLAAILVSKYGPLHLSRLGRAIILMITAAFALCLVLDDPHFDIYAPLVGLGIVLLLAVPGPQHFGAALFGGLSYPLYLNHWIAIYAVKYVHVHVVRLGYVLDHTLVLALAIALSAVLYWCVDRRVLALPFGTARQPAARPAQTGRRIAPRSSRAPSRTRSPTACATPHHTTEAASPVPPPSRPTRLRRRPERRHR